MNFSSWHALLKPHLPPPLLLVIFSKAEILMYLDMPLY